VIETGHFACLRTIVQRIAIFSHGLCRLILENRIEWFAFSLGSIDWLTQEVEVLAGGKLMLGGSPACRVKVFIGCPAQV